MPLSSYNAYFGNKKGSAAEAHAAMVREYGQKKGNSVFYATIAKRKKKGHRTEAMRRMVKGG